MNWYLKLIVEKHDNDIWIATKNNHLISKEIQDCPKQEASNLLEEITGYKIDPYNVDWLSLELVDTTYEKDTKTAYLIYVCRVPSDSKINDSFEWKRYADIHSEIQAIKGVF